MSSLTGVAVSGLVPHLKWVDFYSPGSHAQLPVAVLVETLVDTLDRPVWVNDALKLKIDASLDVPTLCEQRD
jgi:hypothetical protein